MHSPKLDAMETNPTEKLPWKTPEFTHFEAGEAEATDGPGPDGGLAS
jgi:hypothetical protein